MYEQLPHRPFPCLKRCISRKFGAIEARDSTVLVSNPEQLLGSVEGHCLSLRRDGILSRWEEQTPDLVGRFSAFCYLDLGYPTMMSSRLPRLLGLRGKALKSMGVNFFQEQTYFLPVAIHLVYQMIATNPWLCGIKMKLFHEINTNQASHQANAIWQKCTRCQIQLAYC